MWHLSMTVLWQYLSVARREKLRMEKVEKAKPKPKKKILGGLFQSGKSGASKEDEKTEEISKVTLLHIEMFWNII